MKPERVTSSCVFCDRITKLDFDSEVRGVVTFEPLNPVMPGHRLFVPMVHVSDASEKPWVTGHVFEVAAFWGLSGGEPYNLITSAGKPATQSVFHLHVHYVPRRDSDGLALPWTGQQATPTGWDCEERGHIPTMRGWCQGCGQRTTP